jgi:hypothetical protein
VIFKEKFIAVTGICACPENISQSMEVEKADIFSKKK